MPSVESKQLGHLATTGPFRAVPVQFVSGEGNVVAEPRAEGNVERIMRQLNERDPPHRTAPSGLPNTRGAPTDTLRSASNLKEAHSYVGFANFPNQVYRRALKNGFEFTLMVVGESGLGKTTFINSLFLAEISEGAADAESRVTTSTTRIKDHNVRLLENGVSLNFTLVDCPGFGDAIDNSRCWDPILDFIEKKYLEYFSEETKIERASKIVDRRVHLCLYFIAPSGHGLKQLDVEVMKKLHDRVNIIPVIAKADTLTADELANFKRQVAREIELNEIKLYKFPESEDEDEKKQFAPLRQRVPFAVVGSNQIKEENGHRTRYREYPWGTVEVENLKHNDFLALRDLIIRTNLIDLIAVTHNVHYENFRLRQMSKGSKATGEGDPFTQLELLKKEKLNEFEEKRRNMEKMLEEKVAEREKKLDAKQAELDSREAKNREQLEKQRATIDQLMADVVELRRGTSVSHHESRTNISQTSETSPSEKSKMTSKKGLGIFNRS